MTIKATIDEILAKCKEKGFTPSHLHMTSKTWNALKTEAPKLVFEGPEAKRYLQIRVIVWRPAELAGVEAKLKAKLLNGGVDLETKGMVKNLDEEK